MKSLHKYACLMSCSSFSGQHVRAGSVSRLIPNVLLPTGLVVAIKVRALALMLIHTKI